MLIAKFTPPNAWRQTHNLSVALVAHKREAHCGTADFAKMLINASLFIKDPVAALGLDDTKPSVPMTMRQRPAVSLPLRAEVAASDGYARFE